MDISNRIIDRIRNYFVSPIPTIRVCMMGGKGAGKTSVLTSLYINIDKALGKTSLYMLPNGTTTNRLNEKFIELKHMFANSSHIAGMPDSGISGDEAVNSYNFEFGIKQSPDIKLDIEILDFPGEYIERNPDVVCSFVDKSSVVLIAIDSPHLMEEEGNFNDAKNCCSEITTFMQKYLEKTTDLNKMILFVPLKCEKYYYEEKMGNVADRIRNGCYKDLCDELEKNHKTKIASAIVPILTVGDIVFDDFSRDTDGNIITVSKPNGRFIPQAVNYKFRTSKPEYSPLNCEQPVCYLLSFVAKQYEASKNAPPKSALAKLLAKFKSVFKIISDNPKLLLEISRLKQARIIDQEKDGFITITGKNLF